MILHEKKNKIPKFEILNSDGEIEIEAGNVFVYLMGRIILFFIILFHPLKGQMVRKNKSGNYELLKVIYFVRYKIKWEHK